MENLPPLRNLRDMTAAAVRAAVLQLSDFGDVQVMLSYSEVDGSTTTITDGAGNWHARVGMAKSFLIRADAREAADAEADLFEEEEEDTSEVADDDDEDKSWMHEADL